MMWPTYVRFGLRKPMNSAVELNKIIVEGSGTEETGSRESVGSAKPKNSIT
jgi:hypothetical protein